jgi:type IV pilus biogenesis protein PilP
MDVKVLIATALVLMTCTVQSSHAATVGDAGQNQQNLIILKSALERAKLEKELGEVNNNKVTVAEVCTPNGIGQLHVKSVYGVSSALQANFSYSVNSNIEAKVGDVLMCGEKVKLITLNKVVVERADVSYIVTGNSMQALK